MPTEALAWYWTVLIYAGIPLLFLLVLAAWTILPHRDQGRTIYRPGRPWEHEPVWYEANAEAAGLPAHGAEHATGHGTPVGELEHPGAVAAALAIGEHPHEQVADDVAVAGARRSAAGGARGTW